MLKLLIWNNRIGNTAAAAFLALVMTSNLAAAEMKMAVVDVQAAITASQLMETASKKLEQEFAPTQTDLKTMMNEINTLQARLAKDEAVMGMEESRRLQQEIYQKGNRLKFEEGEAQRKAAARLQELSIPIFKLASELLEEIVKEKKIETVLHRQAVLYIDEKHDITNLLTKKLNEKK